jgi:hypothetical protein
MEMSEPVLKGELIESNEEFLEIVYANLGIEDALERYLGSEAEEEEVDGLLAAFSSRIADTAWEDGSVDTTLVRFAFDHLTGSMNEVASQRYGYESPRTAVQTVLNWFGVAHEPRRYVRSLDDRYWSEQFMDQYQNGGMPMAPRQEDETDEEYLARYTYTCMHGLLFANFTYLKQ